MSNLIESILRADDGDDHPQMLALCEQAVREQPNVALTWALRARCHDKRGAPTERDADLARALALDPQCADALRVRATALYDDGDHEACLLYTSDAADE